MAKSEHSEHAETAEGAGATGDSAPGDSAPGDSGGEYDSLSGEEDNAVGPARHCSPRHRMPYNLRNEGLEGGG